MALIGSINEQGELQGQINGARYLTGVITNASAVGGQVVGMRGLQGEKGDTGDTGATGADGQDGADGFSPSASVSKVDNVATITITDKDGTTTAEVYDGSGGGASAFIAEYGVTTYADVKDAYDEDAIILCTVDDSGNTAILQLAYFDDANDTFYFAQPKSDGFYLASITIGDTWDDGSFQFATTDTATQLRDGLMSALDYQKLDGIASGAEVNVQSDWNEADSTADDYIKNKPTIPPKNVWYGTCSTTSSIQQKSVTTSSGDFALDEGNILLVEFASTNTYDGATLSVDELTAKAIYVNGSPTNDHRWRAGEVVIFVYDGYHFNLVEQGMATTSYYGITKLSSSTSSTSELIAATPKAVKAAYDEATDATEIPTASKKSKFDSSAHMNSTDMTTGADSELEDFIDGLNVSGFDLVEDISDKFTFTSSWSRLVRSAYKIGKLVVFCLEGTASSVTAGTQYTMVTIASGYRPRTTTYYTGHGTNSAYLPQGSVNSIVWTSGDITVRPQTNTCNYIFVSGMYVLP